MDLDVGFLRVQLGAWQWKPDAPHPKWETLAKARLWTLPGQTVPKHGASTDFGRIRKRLAEPLTDVKSSESGKLDVLNIETAGRMVKILCAPYKDPQDPLKFLEPIDTDLLILNGNLVDGEDPLSPVVLSKLQDDLGMVVAIYGEVNPTFEALERILDTEGIREHDYWYEKIQVCYWLPGAGKQGKGGIQQKALVLVSGTKIKKKVCTSRLECEASHSKLQPWLFVADSSVHWAGSQRTR